MAAKNPIFPIHIGNIIRNALVFNPQRWQGAPWAMDELLQTVNDLFTLLHQHKIEYVLVGEIALLQYIQGRNTEDIDLILNMTALARLPDIMITSQEVYFARGQFQGLQIDFFLTENPLFAHAQKNHVVQQSFFDQTITSATIIGLLLLKLYALPSLYRQGDFARVGLYENDVATMMFYHAPDMQAVVSELTPYVSNQDLLAIQDVLVDLEQRIARFTRNKSPE